MSNSTQPPTHRPLLTLRETAELLGVSIKTVRRWIARGLLKAWKEGRIVRVQRAELERFLRQ